MGQQVVDVLKSNLREFQAAPVWGKEEAGLKMFETVCALIQDHENRLEENHTRLGDAETGYVQLRDVTISHENRLDQLEELAEEAA